MKLMIYGCVVRSNDKGAAVAIERYEFRTQGRTMQPAAMTAAPELRAHFSEGPKSLPLRARSSTGARTRFLFGNENPGAENILCRG